MQLGYTGKSSLLNALLNSTITAVSPKVNTTREDVKGILTVDNHQIVFIDSPGIIASHGRRKFCKDLIKAAWNGYNEADVCLFVIDTVKRPTAELFEILRQLSATAPFMDNHEDTILPDTDAGYVESSMIQECIDDKSLVDDNEHVGNVKSIPIALVLNKIDLVSHKKWIKSRMRELKSHGHFLDIFFVSAKYSTGITPIINSLKRLSKPGLWSYPPDMITTLSKVEIVEQLVRTYIFCWFNKDVPYRVEQKVIGWTYSEDKVLNIEHELYVRTEKVAKMICGTRGRILKQLQKNVSYKLSKLWNEVVFIFIHVKVK
ncbi:GTPase domain-containing protein [Theileria equi strain WA]|uniref:GTPase domain-containing protein n=1 Tax=Theileria equi strain WA TaxID=1537102 RepID=L0B189_THEEQ|nr:GTPase domain-containing protein [Theileria equi strain WA]AFZ81632.1 GTPase domain-containing protein [Theileria equi strain WA]|eukprot:XP_004831298.1 GTPase domain-containing protein [Theileria equi strain WA]